MQALKPHINVITSRQPFEEIEKVHEAVLAVVDQTLSRRTSPGQLEPDASLTKPGFSQFSPGNGEVIILFVLYLVLFSSIKFLAILIFLD